MIHKVDNKFTNYLIERCNKKKEFFLPTISTDRLILKKDSKTDCVSDVYNIFLKESDKHIGKIILIFDGEIWYKINDDEFKNKGYMTEALKGISCCFYEDVYCSIDKKNRASVHVEKTRDFALKVSSKTFIHMSKNIRIIIKNKLYI